MSAAGKRKTAPGWVKVSTFRLPPETLAELDALAGWFAAESGDRETRTGVLRKLIRREYARRSKKGG
jgi:hypothetical protein